ncbi:hypothetical protein [Nocardia sp. NPDC006630]|uniref:hypothetical protein n=1 Tax=Nocardia sp. NPDC006630 TaxID=3157181 RepID=UPI0033B0D3D3
MSETPANGGRARRRVVRKAGPPAEGDAAGIEVQESALGSVSPEPAAVDAAEPSSVAGTTPAPAGDPEPAVAASTGVASANSAAEEDAAPESAGDTEPNSEATSRVRKIAGSLGTVGVAAAVVALISTLVLAGSTGVYFYHQHRADNLSQRRAEYIQVAKQAYLDMSTVKDATADQDIDRLLSVAGGSLKDEYATNRDAYKKVFEQLKVQSTGAVISAAIENDSADSASVLLLAQQTVSNVATNGPMQRDYRIRVHVTRNGQTLSASSLEFVP